MSVHDDRALVDAMLAEPGDELGLTVSRAADTFSRQDHHISADAYDNLMKHLNLWIGTRMRRHYDRTGRGVHNLTVELKVSTTGPMEMGGEEPRSVRMIPVDGGWQFEAIQ